MYVTITMISRVVLLRIEVLCLKVQNFEVAEPHVKLCGSILPAILTGQHYLPKCLLCARHCVRCLYVCVSFLWPLWFGRLFSSKLLSWLLLVGYLPSGPVLFLPNFFNSARRVQLSQKCRSLRLSLTITSFILLKITPSSLCSFLSAWTRGTLYFLIYLLALLH